MNLVLPDVSEFQSPANGNAPNWAGIKAQNGGAAIIRVGYGNAHLDNTFVSNYTALKQNGFSFIGLYHYLRQDQDALSQAQQFCSWVGPISALFPGSIPILDLEEGSGDQSGRANTWLNFVDHFYGLDKLALNQRSWLYSGDNFARNQGLVPIFNSARHTWVAAYQSSEAGLLPHTLWQSTDGQPQFPANRTNWSGCGFVDTSVTHVDLPTLASMGYQPLDPPQSPQPPVQKLQEEQNMLRASEKTTAISFGNGQYDWIAFFADPSVEGKPSQHIRVAPWSADNGGGFAGIVADVVVDDAHEKVTVALPAHCAGISIQRTGTDAGDPTKWAPIAWNLGPVS